jgi:hypothetical protein
VLGATATKSMTRFLFPQNKPKSAVLFALAGISIYLVAGPIVLLGVWLNLASIVNVGFALATVFAAVAFVMAFVRIVGMFSGRYRGLQSRPWREQVW